MKPALTYGLAELLDIARATSRWLLGYAVGLCARVCCVFGPACGRPPARTQAQKLSPPAGASIGPLWWGGGQKVGLRPLSPAGRPTKRLSAGLDGSNHPLSHRSGMPQFIHRPGFEATPQKPGFRSKPTLVSERAHEQARRVLTLQQENEQLANAVRNLEAELSSLRVQRPPTGSSRSGTSTGNKKGSKKSSSFAARADAPTGEDQDPVAAGQTSSSAAPAQRVEAVRNAAVFVHFIPPPLRAKDKKDIPWMVHTCDGDGCREARHVAIHSVSGFETCEGQPPEVAEGRACNCQISNHHLRGYGKVRWENGDAIVENDDAAASDALGVVHRQYREQSRQLREQLGASREEMRRLREQIERITLQRDVALGNETLLRTQINEQCKPDAS